MIAPLSAYSLSLTLLLDAVKGVEEAVGIKVSDAVLHHVLDQADLVHARLKGLKRGIYLGLLRR